jgi:hypothetical protein
MFSRIPNSIDKLKILSYLDIYNCNLPGHIPSSNGKHVKLKFLDIIINSFIGPVANWIFELFSHKFLLGLKTLLVEWSNSAYPYTSKISPSCFYQVIYLQKNVSDEDISLPFSNIKYFDLASCNLYQIFHLLRYISWRSHRCCLSNN